MKKAALNLLSLRSGRYRRSYPDAGGDGLLSAADSGRLTRRAFIGTTGGSLLTPFSEHSRLRVERDSHSVVFHFRRRSWAVDEWWFAGKPRLSVRERASVIDLGLVGAEWPGIGLPASFQARLIEEDGLWRLEMEQDLQAFRSQVPFLGWLEGKEALAAKWPAPLSVHNQSGVAIELAGGVRATLSPDWRWQLSGPGALSVETPGWRLRANSVSLGLAPKRQPSLLRPSPSKRFSLEAHGQAAEDWPAPDLIEGWEKPGHLRGSPGLFDRLQGDFIDLDGGDRAAALILDYAGSGREVIYEPPSTLSDESGNPFILVLEDPRLAVLSGSGGTEQRFLADFADESAWGHYGGTRIKIGRIVDTPPFELVADGSRVESVSFEPALLAFSAPLEGGSSQTVNTPAPAIQPESLPGKAAETSYNWWRGFLFHCDAWKPGRACGPSGPKERGKGLSLDGYRVRVTRPQDMLLLEFEFRGLYLKNRSGKPPVVWCPKEKKGGRPSPPGFLVVHLPPQHIAEQAFYEKTTEQPDRQADKQPDDVNENFAECNEKAVPALPSASAPIFPAKARLSGPSRLAFCVPAGTALEYSLTGLLNWDNLEPSVVPWALPPGQLPESFSDAINFLPREPELTETSIESPYRLHISPHSSLRWKHASHLAEEPVRRFELWHTKLVGSSTKQVPGVETEKRAAKGQVSSQGGTPASLTVRAIWSPDYCRPKSRDDVKDPCERWPSEPFEQTALAAQDRHQLVRLTSDYRTEFSDCDRQRDNPHRTAPITTNRLMLSALGSWMDLRGAWNPLPSQTDLTVTEWTHRATAARDNFVKIVYKGYLYPFAVPASLIKETERSFFWDRSVNKSYVAVLRQRIYISIRTPEVIYPNKLGIPYGSREIPFRKIVFGERNRTTPFLDNYAAIVSGNRGFNFWPIVCNDLYLFRFSAVDHNGATVETSAPMVFVEANLAFDRQFLNTLWSKYKDEPPDRRRSGVTSQKMSLVASPRRTDTELRVRELYWAPQNPDKTAADVPGSKGEVTLRFDRADQPFFFPALDFARVEEPKLSQVAGKPAIADVAYNEVYLNQGFDKNANRGEVYAEVLNGRAGYLPGGEVRALEPLYLTFGGAERSGEQPNGDKAGGVATPNMLVVGLSRRSGAIGGRQANSTGSPGSASRSALVSFRKLADLDPPTIRHPSVGQVGAAQGGQFDPLDFFGGSLKGAKLLGVIPLWDIVQPLAKEALDNLGEAPRILQQSVIKADKIAKEFLESAVAKLEGLRAQMTPALRSRLDGKLQAFKAAAEMVKPGGEPAMLGRQYGNVYHALTDLLNEIQNISEAPAAALSSELETWGKLMLDQKEGLAPAISSLLGSMIPLLNAAEAISQMAAALTSLRERLRACTTSEQYLALATTVDTCERLAYRLRAAVGFKAANLESLAATYAAAVTDLTELLATIGMLLAGRSLGNGIPALMKEKLAKVFAVPPRRPSQVECAQLEAICKKLKEKAGEGVRANVDAVAHALQTRGIDSLRRLSCLDIESGNCFAVPRIAAEQELQAVLGELSAFAATVPDVKDYKLPAVNEKGVLVDVPLLAAALPGHLLAWIRSLTQVQRLGSISKADLSGRLSEVIAVLAAADTGSLQKEMTRLKDRLISDVTEPPAMPEMVQCQEILKDFNVLARAAALALVLPTIKDDKLTAIFQQLSALGQILKDAKVACDKCLKDAAAPLSALIVNAKDGTPAELKPLVSALLDDLLAKLGRLAMLEDLPAAITALATAETRMAQLLQDPVRELPGLINLAADVEKLLKDMGVPTAIETSYSWHPELKDSPGSPPVMAVMRGPDGKQVSKFSIDAYARVDFASMGTPAVTVTGRLENVRINLIPGLKLVTLNVDSLVFQAAAGGRTNVTLKLAEKGVVFGEALSFVMELQKHLNPSEGPFLDIQPTGVTAGFRLSLPSLTMGGLNIYNLRLYTGVALSFTGDPLILEFGVSDRTNPFAVTVGVFGGGGFLLLRLDPSGIQRLEGAIEITARAEINLAGIASGRAEIAAGFYFSSARLTLSDGRVVTDNKLAGYVRARGSLSIVGILNMNVEVYVGLIWMRPNRLYGRATLKVEISMWLFHATYSGEVEYTFAGNEPPNEKRDVRLLNEWDGGAKGTSRQTGWVEECNRYDDAFAA